MHFTPSTIALALLAACDFGTSLKTNKKGFSK